MEPNSHGEDQSKTSEDKLSLRNPMISIGVVDEHSFTRECITRSLRGFDDSLAVVSFGTCDDCLQTTRGLEVVLYYAHHSVVHNSSDDQALVPVNTLQKIAPVIVLSAVDSPHLIIKAFENGARGYIPTASTNPELVIEIIRLVRAGGTFMPLTSLSPRTINGEDATTIVTKSQRFTPRQMAVLNHLRLGKANKIIAYDLGMSESTVKIHIRNLMRKMNATNRTEVACRAQAFVASASK
jgi:DNA-binding NarL/FixJ family response regulator